MNIFLVVKANISSRFSLLISEQLNITENCDGLIIYSDDYYDDNFLNNLLALKSRYITLIVTTPNIDDESFEFFLDFCSDNNITVISKVEIESHLHFTESYNRFNKFYQTLQPDLNYDYWFNKQQFDNKDVVDLGAGIPHYLHGLTPKSYIGIDLSSTMIKEAKTIFPDYHFLNQNICEYRTQDIDIVISILDVINYLPTIGEVEVVFNNVFASLKDKGKFIFDIHTESCLTAFDDYFEFCEIDDQQFIWESQVTANSLIHYFQITDENYHVYFEKHYQFFYTLEQIVNLLYSCGFSKVENILAYNHYIITATKEN